MQYESKNLARVVQALAALGLLASLPASAEEFDTLQMGLGAVYTHDTNLFRSELVRVSENSAYGYGYLSFDKQISRQEIVGSFQMGKVKYTKNPQLDYTAEDLSLRWLGDFPRDLKTTVSATRNTQLQNFADARSVGQQGDVITRDTLSASLDQRIYDGLFLNVQSQLSRRRDSNELYRANSTNGRSLGGGLKYVRGDGSFIGINFLATRTNVPYRNVDFYSDNAYYDRSAFLEGYYAFSPANQLHLRIGNTSRAHEHLTERNFAGPTFQLVHSWLPTESWVVNTTLARDVGASGDNNLVYSVIKSVRVAPSWSATPKITVGGTLQWSENQYLGDVSSTVQEEFRQFYIGLRGEAVGNALFLAELPYLTSRSRDDKTTSLSVNASYTPRQWVRASLNLQSDRRRSNVSGLSYTDQSLGLTLQAQF